MGRVYVNVDGKSVEVEVFTGDGSNVLLIDDRYYRVYHADEGHYFMTNVRNVQLSVKGEPLKIIETVARIHLIHKRYGRRVQNKKEEAQRVRDEDLRKVVGDL